jgi:hypothetical protein
MLVPVISTVWCPVMIVAEVEGNRPCLTQGSTAKFCLDGLKRRDVTSGLSVPFAIVRGHDLKNKSEAKLFH